MIDMIYSKLAIAIAGLMILTGMTGFYIYNSNRMGEIYLNEVCEIIVQRIDEMSNVNAEAKYQFSFDTKNANKPNVIMLPISYDNNDYTFTITENIITVQWKNKIVYGNMISRPHMWNPGDMTELSEENILLGNKLVPEISFFSGEDFFIERKLIKTPNEEYHSFIYTKSTIEPQEILNTYVKNIDNFFNDEEFRDIDSFFNDNTLSEMETSNLAIVKTRSFRFDKELIVYKGLLYCNYNGIIIIHTINVDYYGNPQEVEDWSISDPDEEEDLLEPKFITDILTCNYVVVSYNDYLNGDNIVGYKMKKCANGHGIDLVIYPRNVVPIVSELTINGGRISLEITINNVGTETAENIEVRFTKFNMFGTPVNPRIASKIIDQIEPDGKYTFIEPVDMDLQFNYYINIHVNPDKNIRENNYNNNYYNWIFKKGVGIVYIQKPDRNIITGQKLTSNQDRPYYPDDTVSDWIEENMKTIDSGYYFTDSYDIANTIILVGGPIVNSYTSDLNMVSKYLGSDIVGWGGGSTRWGFWTEEFNDPYIRHPLYMYENWKYDPDCGIIGTISIDEEGIISSYNMRNNQRWEDHWDPISLINVRDDNINLLNTDYKNVYYGKDFILLYGVDIEGTIVAAKEFIKLLSYDPYQISNNYLNLFHDEALSQWFEKDEIIYLKNNPNINNYKILINDIVDFSLNTHFYDIDYKKEYMNYFTIIKTCNEDNSDFFSKYWTWVSHAFDHSEELPINYNYDLYLKWFFQLINCINNYDIDKTLKEQYLEQIEITINLFNIFSHYESIYSINIFATTSIYDTISINMNINNIKYSIISLVGDTGFSLMNYFFLFFNKVYSSDIFIHFYFILDSDNTFINKFDFNHYSIIKNLNNLETMFEEYLNIIMIHFINAPHVTHLIILSFSVLKLFDEINKIISGEISLDINEFIKLGLIVGSIIITLISALIGAFVAIKVSSIAGATLGSFAGPIGTILGFLVGALIGAIIGTLIMIIDYDQEKVKIQKSMSELLTYIINIKDTFLLNSAELLDLYQQNKDLSDYISLHGRLKRTELTVMFNWYSNEFSYLSNLYHTYYNKIKDIINTIDNIISWILSPIRPSGYLLGGFTAKAIGILSTKVKLAYNNEIYEYNTVYFDKDNKIKIKEIMADETGTYINYENSGIGLEFDRNNFDRTIDQYRQLYSSNEPKQDIINNNNISVSHNTIPDINDYKKINQYYLNYYYGDNHLSERSILDLNENDIIETYYHYKWIVNGGWGEFWDVGNAMEWFIPILEDKLNSFQIKLNELNNIQTQIDNIKNNICKGIHVSFIQTQPNSITSDSFILDFNLYNSGINTLDNYLIYIDVFSTKSIYHNQQYHYIQKDELDTIYLNSKELLLNTNVNFNKYIDLDMTEFDLTFGCHFFIIRINDFNNNELWNYNYKIFLYP